MHALIIAEHIHVQLGIVDSLLHTVHALIIAGLAQYSNTELDIAYTVDILLHTVHALIIAGLSLPLQWIRYSMYSWM